MKALAIITGDTAVILHGLRTIDELFKQQLFEKYSGKYYQINGLYNLRLDNGSLDLSIRKHLHLFQGKTELGAFNIDGSSHDNSSFTIPGKVTKFIQRNKQLSDFIIPDGRIIEASAMVEPIALSIIDDLQAGKEFPLYIIDLDEFEKEEEENELSRKIAEYMEYFLGK